MTPFINREISHQMKEFLYFNCELFGALGISDYSFECIIEANNEEEAMEWGNQIAAKYDELYGLMPSGDRLDRETLRQNASIIDLSESPKSSDVKHRCRYGEYPDFNDWT